VLLQGLITQLL
jgi:hypothetical protein